MPSPGCRRRSRPTPSRRSSTVSPRSICISGTLTLSGDTLLHTVLEIAESLYRAGFRKLLMINGHGGQPQILQIACREMRLRHGDFIAIPHDVFNVPNCEKQFLSPHEQRMAMHAGHSETALMLALAPECVHMERAVANFPPEFPCPTLSKGRPAAAWASYDFGPSGVIGDPTPATREQGEGLLDSLAASWAQAIIEIHRMAWVERHEPTWANSTGTALCSPSPSFAAESKEP